MRFPNIISILFFLHCFTLISMMVNAASGKDLLINDILSFSERNGKRYLAVTTMDVDDVSVKTFHDYLISKAKLLNSVYSKTIMPPTSAGNSVSLITDALDFHRDTLLIVASAQDSSHWDHYLELLAKTKVMSTILVLAEPILSEQRGMLVSKLERLAKNTFFYWPLENSNERNETIWNRLITLDNVEQVVINKLNFNQFGHIVEDYDMQGIHIMSTTVSWPPYITLSEECKELRKHNDKCIRNGFLVDALDYLGIISNFTWESHNDPDDNYGTTPLTGPANASGTWGGVVGDVVAGNYHFSMSTWVWKEERQDMFDFSSIVTDRSALAITLKAKEIDYTLLTRPFTNKAWYLIGFAAVLFTLSAAIPYLCIPHFGNSTSSRMIEFVAFAFFMLTEIYYSGALTMFFSTAPPLPFETMREVMQDYPTWKLMMRYGNDVYYVYKVQEGDADYVAFWERVKNTPEEAVFKSVGEGMNKVLTDFYVAQMQEGSIKGWIRENPIEGEKVKIFGRGKANFYTLIVTNNSPLGPIFNVGCLKMIQTGIKDRISAQWLERKKTTGGAADLSAALIVLKPGQLILIYFLTSLTIVVTLSVFCLEHIWKCMGCGKVIEKEGPIFHRRLEAEISGAMKKTLRNK